MGCGIYSSAPFCYIILGLTLFKEKMMILKIYKNDKNETTLLAEEAKDVWSIFSAEFLDTIHASDNSTGIEYCDKINQIVEYTIKNDCLTHKKEIEIIGGNVAIGSEDSYSMSIALDMASWKPWPATKEQIQKTIEGLIQQHLYEIDLAKSLLQQINSITKVEEFQREPTPEQIVASNEDEDEEDEDDD